MRSIDVANLFIQRCGQSLYLTNLSLNKLVYFAQVEALKARPERPLFDDEIEAWAYGPVEPVVYQAFKEYGDSRIEMPNGTPSFSKDTEFAIEIVDRVAETYGSLSAFDLVDMTHREGSAWKNKFAGAYSNAQIGVEDIKQSVEYSSDFDSSKTFAAAIQNVQNTWPNALRMLEDA